MPESPLEGKPFNPYGRFYNAWVPTQLLQSVEISDGAKLAYGLLRKFAGKDGACFPLQSTLARELGCARRTARSYIRELKRAGLIRVKSRGKGRSLQYEFLWKNCLDVRQIPMADRPSSDAVSGRIQPTEEVQVSGSLNRNSSSRACGNVEISGDHPSDEAVAENQEEAGSSERSGEGKNGDAGGVDLTKAGWKIVMLGNGHPQDTDVSQGLQWRNTIKEMAWDKRMDRRKQSL